ESAAAWRAVQATAAGADGSRVTGSVSSTGQYAWLLADTIPAAPAQPADGAIVSGVAAATVPDPATGDVAPQPRILFYNTGGTSRVTSVLHTDAPMPSGTVLRSRISESYRFTSGSEIQPEPFVEDIVFFQNSALTRNPQSAIPNPQSAADFVVTPSQTFDA